jgi:cytochrome P450
MIVGLRRKSAPPVEIATLILYRFQEWRGDCPKTKSTTTRTTLEIDDDPYPVWKRLRDDARSTTTRSSEFYALSRWDDVEAALLDWDTYRSGRGTTLDVIRANVEIPPGIILFEDPPLHDLHRGLLTRVFTPKRMNAIEPMVRRYCAGLLDSLIDAGDFDVIADFGVFVPMRTIGFLLGIPEEGRRRSAGASTRGCA